MLSGAAGFGADGLFPPNISDKVCPANDERRTRLGGDCGCESSDIISSELGRSGCGKKCRVGVAGQVLALRPKHLSDCLLPLCASSVPTEDIRRVVDKVEVASAGQVSLYLDGPSQVYVTRLRDEITRSDDGDSDPMYPVEQWS